MKFYCPNCFNSADIKDMIDREHMEVLKNVQGRNPICMKCNVEVLDATGDEVSAGGVFYAFEE